MTIQDHHTPIRKRLALVNSGKTEFRKLSNLSEKTKDIAERLATIVLQSADQ
jgi:hypothetical protein